jgi:hypothetical protein
MLQVTRDVSMRPSRRGINPLSVGRGHLREPAQGSILARLPETLGIPVVL